VAAAQKELDEELARLAENPDDEDIEGRVEYAERELNNEQRRNSRLFAIDAGTDRVALRKTYPDGGRYIIVQAQLALDWDYDENENESDKKIWVGRIEGMLIENINIPLKYRAVFDTIEQNDSSYDNDNWSPGYKAKVAFGKRLEPWLIAVESLVSGDQK